MIDSKFIFVCSPGRSGTKYFSEIFKNMTNIPSYHGGESNLRNIIDSGVFRDNSNLDIIKDRVDAIKNLANNFGYFDSSQIFIHRLVNHIIVDNYFEKLFVINLIRNPLEVAVSYENRNSAPSFKDDLWRLPLISNDRIIKINKKLTLFQENLFDWIDTQMKFELYKKNFDKHIVFKFEDINNMNKIKNLFDYFEIEFDEKKFQNLKDTFLKNENESSSKITKRHITETNELILYLQQLNDYPKIIIDTYILPLIS